jgi:hypothetical protein
LLYEAKEDAELFLRIFAFPEVATSTIGYAGAESFVYMIRVTNDAFVDHVLPLVVPADDSSVRSVAYGCNLPAKLDVIRRGATKYSPIVNHVESALGWQWQAVGGWHEFGCRWNMRCDLKPAGERTRSLTCTCHQNLNLVEAWNFVAFSIFPCQVDVGFGVAFEPFGFIVEGQLRP